MIDYAQTKVGDILRITGAGAPGFAKLGDLVRVVETKPYGVNAEAAHGGRAEFAFNCGAERLEPTEWRDDFPVEQKS